MTSKRAVKKDKDSDDEVEMEDVAKTGDLVADDPE